MSIYLLYLLCLKTVIEFSIFQILVNNSKVFFEIFKTEKILS